MKKKKETKWRYWLSLSESPYAKGKIIVLDYKKRIAGNYANYEFWSMPESFVPYTEYVPIVLGEK